MHEEKRRAPQQIRKGDYSVAQTEPLFKENPSIMIATIKNLDSKLCRFDVVDPVDGEKYCLEFDQATVCL